MLLGYLCTKLFVSFVRRAAFGSVCLLLPLCAVAGISAQISGKVLFSDLPACALVLANGQHTFSCGGDGRYELTIPLDAEGRATLFAFADGFDPYETTLHSPIAETHHIALSPAEGTQFLSVAPTLHPGLTPGWVQLRGTVSWGQLPVCALVLANGQSMFTCEGSLGRFALDVPTDARGEVTLFAFASGFAPYKTTLSTRVTASGSVVANAQSHVDSDVNDPAALYLSNDTLDLAQPVRNPSNIGGYVNQPFRGPAGRSYSTGDTSDIYRVSLVAGQPLRVLIGNPDGADLDLFLVDSGRRLVASSEGVGQSEQIIGPRDGEYFVEVYAYSGASTYVLTVAGTAAPANEPHLSVVQEFVPGELLIRGAQDAAAVASIRQLRSALAALRLTHVRGALHRGAIYQMANTTGDRVRQHQGEHQRAFPVALQYANIDPAKVETVHSIKALRREQGANFVEPNHLLFATQQPNDQFYPYQWHYRLINLPQAWDITVGDPKVVTAVVDTGILSSHPDVRESIVAGYDFVSNPLRAMDGDGIDPDPEDPGDPSGRGLAFFHGTHVAGTIAAMTNNSVGVAGISWNSAIMPIRVLGTDGVGTAYDVLQGVRYAAGLENDSRTVPALPADVINLSLAGGVFSNIEQDLYTEVAQKGVIVVAAAGNQSSAAPSYPAAYHGVISVGAVTANERRATYSNFGATLDLVAPGGSLDEDLNGDGYPDGVLSTGATTAGGVVTPAYLFMQGTSMAAPHVAGVAGLMKSLSSELSYAAFMDMLSTGELTRDLGEPGRDLSFGWGIIDAAKALAAVSAATPGGSLVAVPEALNFGIGEDQLPVRISLGNGADGLITGMTVSAPWIEVMPVDIDDRGLGQYLVSIDRTNLKSGAHVGAVHVEADESQLIIRINVEVADVDMEADVGRQYVLLIDPRTGATIRQSAVDALAGRYGYTFQEVPIGEYQLVSGSDLNNNGLICDELESCGAYPTLGSTQSLLTLTRDAESLDFLTGFPAFIQQPASSEGSVGTPVYRRELDLSPGYEAE